MAFWIEILKYMYIPGHSKWTWTAVMGYEDSVANAPIVSLL